MRIRKEYPKQYEMECEHCGKRQFLNKPYYKKYGWKHNCTGTFVEPSPEELKKEFVLYKEY